MKVPFINDTHFGARNDSQIFLDYSLDFFENQFFPYCDEHGVTEIVHLGDFLDRRKYVNFNTLTQVRERFVEPLEKRGIKIHCILGNHDTYFRNTNKVNSLREVFSPTQSFEVYEKPTITKIDDIPFAFLPWINKENYDESVEFIKNKSASYLCGHLELNGFQVMRGVNFQDGMDPSLFAKYAMVLSGHFHTKHTKGNIHYLGTQYQLTFSDLKEKKGFHVFDTETTDLEFIENTRRLFHSLVYDDEAIDAMKYMNADYSEFKDKFVKIYVASKQYPFTFDKVLDKLYSVQPVNVQVVEDVQDDVDDEERVDLAKGTLDIIYEEIDSLSEEVDNPMELKKIFRDIYMEAITQ